MYLNGKETAMYEQDYIMRMNRDAVRVIAKLIFNKDVNSLKDIVDDETAEDNIHKTTYIQDGMDDILKMEEELLRDLKQNKSRALERAVLFYLRLCEENEEFLQSHDYSHDMIKERLSEIAERLGIAGIIKTIYI